MMTSTSCVRTVRQCAGRSASMASIGSVIRCTLSRFKVVAQIPLSRMMRLAAGG